MTRRIITALAAAVLFLAGLSLGLTVRAAEAPRSAPAAIPAVDMEAGHGQEGRSSSGNLPELTGAPQGASGVSIVAGETSPGPGSTPGASAAPAPSTKARRHVVTGIASTYGPGWDGWIAWPAGPGWRLRVCGDGGCRTVVSTDAGPDKAMQRAGRVVDLDVRTFEAVCGAPWTIGLCHVVVTVLGR